MHFPVKGVPALVLGVLCGAAAFSGLGYALSTFADSADSAQPMIQLIMFPLFFISGIWIPLSELPNWLATIARIFPVEHVADLIHRAYVGAVPFGPVLVDVAVLLAWAVRRGDGGGAPLRLAAAAAGVGALGAAGGCRPEGKGRGRLGHGPGRLWPWPRRPGVRGEVTGRTGSAGKERVVRHEGADP